MSKKSGGKDYPGSGALEVGNLWLKLCLRIGDFSIAGKGSKIEIINFEPGELWGHQGQAGESDGETSTTSEQSIISPKGPFLKRDPF